MHTKTIQPTDDPLAEAICQVTIEYNEPITMDRPAVRDP